MSGDTKSTIVSTGQRWSPLGSKTTWTVVSIVADGTVGLSGPGPCRGMRYVSVDELSSSWSLAQ